MKKTLLAILMLVGLGACSSNEDYDEVPSPIIMFITQYWPNPIIENYSHPSSGEYDVDVKGGPSFEFDSNYSWTEVDGNGMPLPQVFLYDQLPQTLYDYLEGGSYLDQVFEVERNSKTYSLDLLNIDLTYDIATATIRQDK